MTLLAVAVTMLAVLIGGDVAGYEIIRPMAIVVLGGIVTSAITTLFVVPALYRQIARRPAPIDELFSPDGVEEV